MSVLLEGNPFHVLELDASATGMDVHRAGQKLLGMLELDLPAARTYLGPQGPRPRTADAVRQAMASLADPDRRLIAELLANAGSIVAQGPAPIPAWTGA